MEATEHDSPKLTMKQNQSKPTLSIAYPTAIAVCLLILGGASAQADEDIESFSRLSEAPWEEVLHDSCTQDWQDTFTLDGKKATITHSEKGMDFLAGPKAGNDAHHAVLWTKKDFQGDLKIEYEYTRLDSEARMVTILYIQATGSGEPGFGKDITTWAKNREVPAMKTYFNHMNTYHISYAAFGTGTREPGNDYIRGRRYMAAGLKETNLENEWTKTGLFETGVPHKITVIKQDRDIYMHIRNAEKELLCHFVNTKFPPITEGRIGLRHMYTRGARYKDFKVSVPAKKSPVPAVKDETPEVCSDDEVLPFGKKGKFKMLYDVRQRPQSVLLHGRLFLVYNGDATPTEDLKGNACPMFISYDPKTRSFTDPVRIGPRHSDHHYSPIIWADEKDYLHVLHGCHRTPGVHLVSSEPVGPGTVQVTWEEEAAIAPKISYPTVHRIYDQKEVLAYRNQGHSGSWTYLISNDNGKTWTGPQKDVTDLDSKGRIDWSAYRTALPSKDGKYLHMVYTDYDDYVHRLTPDRLYNSRYKQDVNNQWKYNLHYVKINLRTHEVVNADGQTVETPVDIDSSKKRCLIWDTDGRGAGVPPAMCLDETGVPAFLHVLSEDDLKTHRYYYVRREDGQWKKTPVCASNHQWNSGHLSRDAEGVLHAYVVVGEGYLEGGYMDRHGGGIIEEWISRDKGTTWKKRRELTPDPNRYPGWRFNNVQPVVRPDGSFVDGMLLFYGWKDAEEPSAKAFLFHELP